MPLVFSAASRPSFLAAACLLLINLLPGPAVDASAAADDEGWAQRDVILSTIVAPTFPARDFLLTDFGAVGDGRTDAQPAFVRAIAACHDAGGGRVVVPPGEYLSNGPLHLKSNVNVHLAEGATVTFGTDPRDYLPVVLTRWEGTMLWNYSPLVYAYGQANIAITGRGTLNGNARPGTPFADFRLAKYQNGDRDLLRKMGAEQRPLDQRIFGAGHYLRPSAISPTECTGVLIEGITIRDVPFWTIHPVLCRNVTVRGVRVESSIGNNDGCDPDSCSGVLIEDCHFQTGDDAIAIKSGRDQDGWAVNRPSENIIVRRVTGDSRFYVLCIGSEMSGGVRNVFMEDCRVLRGKGVVYIKANLDRGGMVENVRARRITAAHVGDAVVRFETGYHGYRGENHPPVFRNFVFEDITCDEVDAYAIFAEGVPASAVRDVVLRRVTVSKAAAPTWLRHIENLQLEEVTVNGTRLPAHPALTPDGETKLKVGL